MEWNLRVPFETMYAGAQKYYTEHGNLDLSQKAVVNGLKLGSWISEQKQDCVIRKRGLIYREKD